MATALHVTPAGNQLFRVEIAEETAAEGPKSELGAARTIDVGVPDTLAGLVADEDVALQDVVREGVRFVLEREAIEDLPTELDLGSVADRHPGFVEAVVTAAQRRAADSAPPPGAHTAERNDTDSDDRLVAETRAEQQEGQASSGPERF